MSEAPTNQTGSAIANPDPKPITSTLRRSEFMGISRFDVKDEDFKNCVQGRKKWSRWSSTISDEGHRKELAKEFSKGKPIIVRNETTKAMVYLR